MAPNLASPLAVQGDSGDLSVGSARLLTNPQQMVLVAQEEDLSERVWVAMNPLGDVTPLRLETPCGTVTAEEWGLGRIEWRAPKGGPQELVIEALRPLVGLQIPDGVVAELHIPKGV